MSAQPGRWTGKPGADLLYPYRHRTPYVPLSEDEEFIYGRGACDTKGITACFLAAGERLLAEGLDDFGYLFVVGEEIDNVGAIAANRSVRCGHLVVGEPTENRIALGHKGALGARVRVEGRACHSAYPEEGDSAIHRLLGYLQRVLRTDFGNSELLGAATVNIGGIEGGVAHNVLAPSASAEVMIRVVGDIAEVGGTHRPRYRQLFDPVETVNLFRPSLQHNVRQRAVDVRLRNPLADQELVYLKRHLPGSQPNRGGFL